MKEIPRIDSVMTPMPHSIEAGSGMHEAQEVMERHGVRHLPVTEEGKLAGLVSDRDVRSCLDPLLNTPTMHRIREIMTQDPYVVGADTPLDEVLTQLVERRIGCAIVQEEGKVVGIFTTTDATRVLAELLRS